MFQFVRTLNCLICGQMPAGAQQQVVNREKQWSSGSSKPPPHPPLALPPHSAGSEVCCFESHSHAPEGLLIPISDNGPQSLIIYSCPPVNNRTKQNKKKMIETDEKEGGKSKTFPPSEVSLPEHRCWPPRDDSHQNHNCLHCCHFLILAAQVFNFKIDLFQGRLSSRQRRREKAAAFSLNFWLLLKPKLLPREGSETERLGLNCPSTAITTPCYVELATVVLIQMHSTTWTIQCTIWLI